MTRRGLNARGRCAPNIGHRDVWAPARHSRARWSSLAAARGHAGAALRYCRCYRRDRVRARVPRLVLRARRHCLVAGAPGQSTPIRIRESRDCQPCAHDRLGAGACRPRHPPRIPLAPDTAPPRDRHRSRYTAGSAGRSPGNAKTDAVNPHKVNAVTLPAVCRESLPFKRAQVCVDQYLAAAVHAPGTCRLRQGTPRRWARVEVAGPRAPNR